MHFELNGLEIDNFFKVLNFIFCIARSHNATVRQDELPYIVQIKTDNAFEVFRQLQRVAILKVENNMLSVVADDTKWGNEFKTWVYDGTRS